MTVNTGSADPLTLRLLPEYNPSALDRRTAWDALLNSDVLQQLKNFIHYRNGTSAADDDILQETLLLAFCKVENGDYRYGEAPFVAYLKAVAGFKILEAARERFHASLDDFEEALPDPHAEFISAEPLLAGGPLLTALNDLPPRRRDVLLLAELYDHSGEEIAQRLHIRPDLVRKDKSLALQQLRRALAPELPDLLQAAA